MASPSSPTDSNPPSAVPLPLPAPPPPATSSRRLPPPCWGDEETAALIEAYREKWYSLGRTNLKSTHWQEVADTVAERCPNASLAAKTSVQCRHKMEKLRKRYRSETQRLRSLPVPRSRASSSWVHFKSMDSMEKGPSPPKQEPLSNSNNNHLDDPEDLDDDELYEEFKNGGGSNTRSLDKFYRNGIGGSGGGGGGSGSGGFRIRIPTGVSVAQPGSKLFGNQKMNNNNPSDSGSRGFANGGTRGVKERQFGSGNKRERDPVGEMVSAIKVLRDGFVRMEQMKMEMAKEIEQMRMEMEMKRTEMILESQQRIVEAFAKAVSEKKKRKGNTVASPSEQ